MGNIKASRQGADNIGYKNRVYTTIYLGTRIIYIKNKLFI